jgi:hypothetical protein
LKTEVAKKLGPFDIGKIPETQKYIRIGFSFCGVKTKIKQII